MTEKLIQNCEVRFQFKCPKQWVALKETAEPGVRSCSQCQKHVYFCQSPEEVARHAREGHCVAVPAGLTAPKSASDDFEQLQALAIKHGVPAVRLCELELDPDLFRRVGRDLARKHSLVPVGLEGFTLRVAMSDPTNPYAIDDVKFITGYNVSVVLASPRDIQETLDRADREDGPHIELGVIDERAFNEG